ncbi:hypothetical protein K501DRAFT_268525, partial [Backusella circina FSU 941]
MKLSHFESEFGSNHFIHFDRWLISVIINLCHTRIGTKFEALSIILRPHSTLKTKKEQCHERGQQGCGLSEYSGHQYTMTSSILCLVSDIKHTDVQYPDEVLMPSMVKQDGVYGIIQLVPGHKITNCSRVLHSDRAEIFQAFISTFGNPGTCLIELFEGYSKRMSYMAKTIATPNIN